MNICPRCKVNNLKVPDVRNALSRRDNLTMVCADCGQLEALEDAGHLHPWTGSPYWRIDNGTSKTS